MIEAAHRGEFDVIVVWAQDRFGRSMVGNLQAVLDVDQARCESSASGRQERRESGSPAAVIGLNAAPNPCCAARQARTWKRVHWQAPFARGMPPDARQQGPPYRCPATRTATRL